MSDQVGRIAKYQDLLQLKPLWLVIEDRQLQDEKSERLRVRERLRDYLKDLLVEAALFSEEPFDWNLISNLDQKPQTPFAAISISHCLDWVGFAISSEACSIGFDLEMAKRVKQNIMARMSTPDEVELAPSPAHLWSAKEAAFKSYPGKSQPKVLSEIQISGWQPASATIHTFSYNTSVYSGLEIGGQGLTDLENGLMMSLCCLCP